MSRHDDFQELETRLRQQRPTTEPMPPAFKRQLRTQLVEDKMKETRRAVFSPLRLALGGLALLLLPLLFWLWQMGLRGESISPAVSAPSELEPAATIVVEAMSPEEPAEMAEDRVEVVASYPLPQTVLNSQRPTVLVLVEYELNTAEEAELILKLTQPLDEDAGRGVVSASQVITRGQGTAVLPLTVDPAELTGDELSLNVLLRDTSPDVEKLLYLDFPAGFQWSYEPGAGETVEQQPMAIILGSGLPEPMEEGRLVPDANGYQVRVHVAYELGEYKQGYVTLGYDYEGPRGGTGGANTQWVSGEESITTFVLILEPEFFYEDGSFREEVEFSLELLGTDEELGENVTIFPEEAVQAQLNIREHLDIQSVVMAEDDQERPALKVELWYERRLAVASTISLTVDAGPELLAAESIPVSRRRDSVTALLPIDLASYTGDFLLRVAASLETEEGILLADYPLQVGSLLSERINEVWLISMDPISATVGSGAIPSPSLIVVAGYGLSDEYEYGILELKFEQPTRNGGGSHVVEPGTGSFQFSMPASQQFALGELPADMSLTLELRGVTADGTETVLSTWKLPHDS